MNTKTIRIQMFDLQVNRIGYMKKCKYRRTGINLHDGTAEGQHWKYIGLGFYWRNL